MTSMTKNNIIIHFHIRHFNVWGQQSCQAVDLDIKGRIEVMSCIPIFWVRVIKVSPNLLKLDCFLLCNDWIVADYNSPRNKTLEVSIDEPEL